MCTLMRPRWSEIQSLRGKTEVSDFYAIFLFLLHFNETNKIVGSAWLPSKTHNPKRIIDFLQSRRRSTLEEIARLLRMADASPFGQRHQHRNAIISRNQKSSSWIKIGQKLGIKNPATISHDQNIL